MSELMYEAAVYSRTVKYRNYKGEEKSAELFFALDPITLMQVIATFEVKPNKKSGNPATRAAEPTITDEAQIKFIRDLASKAAGFPSEDGETWEPFANFADSIAGKAFLTRLTSSDGDRKEFSEKVILDPFRSFANFAKNDPSNSQAEVAQFDTMLAQMENIFKAPDPKTETLEERKERLARELESLGE